MLERERGESKKEKREEGDRKRGKKERGKSKREIQDDQCKCVKSK